MARISRNHVANGVGKMYCKICMNVLELLLPDAEHSRLKVFSYPNIRVFNNSFKMLPEGQTLVTFKKKLKLKTKMNETSPK
jgi:hypothetical protein